MMFWIYDYPSWAVAVLFCGVFAGVTWCGIFFTRATVHSWIHRDKRANDMVGLALESFFVLFGLLLGLVAVATYQNYSTVSDIVDKEADSIAALYRDFAGYPQPIRGQLQERLREYARATIEDGWPQQRLGIVPTGGSERVTSLFQLMAAFEPAKKSEEIVHAEALREFNELIEHRRSRLANVTTGLPAVLWWVVAFGALLNIVLIWMQDMEIHVHLILGGILASILGAVIFLIAALDNPFRGIVSVGPDAIALVYETLMQKDGSGAAAGGVPLAHP
ncbi:MAG: DUF4239 domain-containing protein [Beijerinckiaceae bacterium]|nr:DUF4239 domain-containing protein [Beijerinckiaceae bacterium]